VGRDKSGPLDSTRTAANGSYVLSYHVSGDTSAIYFVSSSYGGIAYFAAPLRREVVRGDDASITVFDTTSTAIPIHTAGRHIILGVPNADGRRPVGEVYDLQNDTTVTLVARDSVTPVWTTHIPSNAQGFQLNTNGDLANGALTRNGSTVGVMVPLSPGIRQIAFTYEMPADAFPWSIPLESSTGILELLIQEPTAKVQGIPLRETEAQAVEGRTFRRFLAQDLPGNAVVQIDVPRVIGKEREKVYLGVATVLLAAMAAALVLTARRSFSRTMRAAPARAESGSEVMLRELAALDAEFERNKSPDDAARAAYEARRAEMKQQLMDRLAAERKRS
jgi:hypothetical protein